MKDFFIRKLPKYQCRFQKGFRVLAAVCPDLLKAFKQDANC